jgi:hypothetical protein
MERTKKGRDACFLFLRGYHQSFFKKSITLFRLRCLSLALINLTASLIRCISCCGGGGGGGMLAAVGVFAAFMFDPAGGAVVDLLRRRKM